MRRLIRFVLLVALAGPMGVAIVGAAYTVVTPVSTLMLGRWLSGQPVARTFVPLGAISPALPAAVIASEDARFCQHAGVDWGALREVIADADQDGPSRGASTVPMQVAKNLFLWPSRSVVRKGLELPIALYLDLVWSKARMIEVYLNIAEWGDGLFGAEAAALRYFGKSAADLTRREAALLAAALPNPLRRDPSRPSAAMRRRAAAVTARTADTPLGCLP